MRKVSGLRQDCIIPRWLPTDIEKYIVCLAMYRVKEHHKVEKIYRLGSAYILSAGTLGFCL